MSEFELQEHEEPRVAASLRPARKGRVRLEFELSPRAFFASLLRGFSLDSRRSMPVSNVLELEREKLRRLQFSQKELAEIGFALVTRLAALDRCLVEAVRADDGEVI